MHDGQCKVHASPLVQRTGNHHMHVCLCFTQQQWPQQQQRQQGGHGSSSIVHCLLFKVCHRNLMT